MTLPPVCSDTPSFAALREALSSLRQESVPNWGIMNSYLMNFFDEPPSPIKFNGIAFSFRSLPEAIHLNPENTFSFRTYNWVIPVETGIAWCKEAG